MAAFELRVQSKIDSLLLACQQKGIVSGWEAMVEFLLSENLAVKTRIRPDMVGVHSRNRGRYGIDIVGCHQHGDQILQQGFSLKKASDATCIEAVHYLSLEDEKVNSDTVELSNGLLPPLTSLKALSVGGGRTPTASCGRAGQSAKRQWQLCKMNLATSIWCVLGRKTKNLKTRLRMG